MKSRSDSDVCVSNVRADERTIRFSDASSVRADCEFIRLLVPRIPYMTSLPRSGKQAGSSR